MSCAVLANPPVLFAQRRALPRPGVAAAVVPTRLGVSARAPPGVAGGLGIRGGPRGGPRGFFWNAPAQVCSGLLKVPLIRAPVGVFRVAYPDVRHPLTGGLV